MAKLHIVDGAGGIVRMSQVELQFDGLGVGVVPDAARPDRAIVTIPGGTAFSRVATVDPVFGNDGSGAFNSAFPFATIQAAITAAIGLVPALSSANPAVILIAPGTYAEVLTLVSNVHLASMTGKRRPVILSGAIGWTPGADANLPQAAVDEWVSFNGVVAGTIASPAPISVDATAKTGGRSILEMRDCGGSGITHLGRPAGLLDYVQIFDCIVFGGGPIVLTNTNGNIYHSFILALSVLGTSSTTVQGWQVWGPVTVGGDANLNIDQTDVMFPIAVLGAGVLTPSFSATASGLFSTIAVTAPGAADVRGSEVASPAQLIGAGPIDRSIYRLPVLATVPGANPVVFPVPYVSATYDVLAVENAGAGGGPTIAVTAKTPAGFVLNDPAGGRTFDLLVLMQ